MLLLLPLQSVQNIPQAEYAQSIVENAKKKLENIANYYDSFTSQWENRNSMYEAYMEPDIVYIMSESVLPVLHILPQKDPFL